MLVCVCLGLLHHSAGVLGGRLVPMNGVLHIFFQRKLGLLGHPKDAAYVQRVRCGQEGSGSDFHISSPVVRGENAVSGVAGREMQRRCKFLKAWLTVATGPSNACQGHSRHKFKVVITTGP